jgi:hypothetical protein
VAGGYADCTCGCDDGAPSAVRTAFDALQATVDGALAGGAPLSGPVAMLVAADGAGKPILEGTQRWPFAFTAASVAHTQEEIFQFERNAFPYTELTGADAQTARTLRAAALTASSYAGVVRALDAGQSYLVYLRDQLPAAVETAITAFHAANDQR